MALIEVEELGVRTLVGGESLIEGVTFALDQGETVGLVGWTGSGKTTIGKAVCGLLADNLSASGSLRIDGHEMLGASHRQWLPIRGRTCLFLPQDPLAALDPARRIGSQLREAFRVRGVKPRTKEIEERLAALGLNDAARFLRSFPHQLSGGERQRILLSLIGIIQPRILVADEPTSAVDAVLRQRVVAELLDLKEQYGFGLLVISHDLHVMLRIGGRMLVLRNGTVVEAGPVSEVLGDPKADYTRELLAASTLPTAGEASVIEQKPRIDTESDVGAQTLSANHVTVSFPGTERPALRDVSCVLKRGDVHALVGQSGSGKSTLLRALSRLVNVNDGTIQLDGRDITLATGKHLAELRRTVQIVFQDPYSSLSPTHTVGWLLEEALAVGGTPEPERPAQAAALLDQVGLSSRVAESRPKRLSGGERQRVAIARALCVRPRLLLCDEVTSALDVVSQMRVMSVLMRLREELGLGLAIATHDLSLAARFCGSIQVLWNGEVVEEGPTERILTEPTHHYTQQLVKAAKWEN